MRQTLFRIGGFALLFGVLAARPAHASNRFSFQIGVGAPVVVGPPSVIVASDPYDDGYWEPGYYAWTGYERRWVPRRWVRRYYEARSDRWREERRERERWNRER